MSNYSRPAGRYCLACHRGKPPDQFYISRRQHGGRRTVCAECSRARAKEARDRKALKAANG